MGTFKSTKTFFASPEIIPAIVKDITGTFTNEGYQVQAQDLISGGISRLRKGICLKLYWE